MRVLSYLLGAVTVLGIACVTALNTNRAEVPIEVVTASAKLMHNDESSIVSDNKFYVNIELIVFQEQIDRYPLTWQSFNRAVDEWAANVPVRS
jgi:hypothetical protein